MVQNLIRVAGSGITYALPPFSAHQGAESICPIMKLDGGMKTVYLGKWELCPHVPPSFVFFLSWSQSLKCKGANLPGEQFSLICRGKTRVGTAETSVGGAEERAELWLCPGRLSRSARRPAACASLGGFSPEAGSAARPGWASAASPAKLYPSGAPSLRLSLRTVG